MEDASQERFDALRREHYPKEINKIAAHLTLFHTLPATDEVRHMLLREAQASQPFAMNVTGLRSLGRGVAYTIESNELSAMHQRLAKAFAEHLSAQDRQGFRPHVVVQNKVSGEEAKVLLASLSATFQSFTTEAVGLDWWEYLGGPWRRLERFEFGQLPEQ